MDRWLGNIRKQAAPTREPSVDSQRTFVVSGNRMLPLYRHGDTLIVSNETPVKLGDRVIIECADLDVVGGTLIFRDNSCIVLNSGWSSKRDVVVDACRVKYLGRVLWASQ